MLQTITAPNIGHPIVYHFSEGASAWGQAIGPSVAHLLQRDRRLLISYSRVGAGVTIQQVSGHARLGNIIDDRSVRLEVDAREFHQVHGSAQTRSDARISCDVEGDCKLNLWGHLIADRPSQTSGSHLLPDESAETPAIFQVDFWEINRPGSDTISNLLADIAAKDRKIRELEAKVAFSMCSQ